MTPYENLVVVLDRLRAEAPPSYKSYHPSPDNTDGLNAARAKAFLHLFLKVRFGLIEFAEREQFVTEGTNDGGVDAYFIDTDRKIIYFLQAKFRISERNFEEKTINAEELLMMEIGRILEGEAKSEAGVEYNAKVLEMAHRIKAIGDIGRYAYRVVILANARGVTKQRLATLTGGFPAELIDHQLCYTQLLFPLVSGTYYQADELQLTLSLSNKNAGAKISYTVATEFTNCEITVVFVPTLEIAKALFRYRNSILQYNPRSYLGHEGKSVNSEIRKSIEARATNEFALFNNGITMLSDETYLNERIGQKDRAQLVLVNPQIINGGQTAYTLSIIYREHTFDEAALLFNGKEVLLKIITFQSGTRLNDDVKLQLIEEISRATNSQTAVTTADRRSNERSVKSLQQKLFDKTGLFFERKRGEFADGVREGYISESEVIERTMFFRAALAAQGRLVDATLRKLLVRADYDTIVDVSDEMFERYAFAILLLREILSQSKHGIERISGFVLVKVYFGLAVAFEPAMTNRERQDVVSRLAPTLEAMWYAFGHHFYQAYKVPLIASRRSRQVEHGLEAYLNSARFNQDLATFVASK